MSFKYLPGLNTLRFFAALFVIIGHGAGSLLNLHIADGTHLAFLNRGADSVEFFFTLSGFLITYLLINEQTHTKTISIKKFYLRRLFRIWPLYFLIVAIGFILLGIIYPKIYGKPYFNFPSTLQGLLMFIFFIPNYAARKYAVGLMFPLWSIGVEEQFYLFWAPMVKKLQRWLLFLVIAFAIISTALYLLIYLEILHVPADLLPTLKFFKIHFMAIGCMFGYLLYHGYNWYNRSVFAKPLAQVIIWFVILYHYLIGFSFSGVVYFHVLLAFFYGLLILNVSVIDKKIVSIEKKPFIYLGVISYGLYMFHMLIDYFLRMVFAKPFLLKLPQFVLVPAYYGCLLGITILVAGLSYKYFETYFINLKMKFSQI